LQAWFSATDTDRSGSITANELASMPVMNKPIGFVTAQALIKVFDKDYSGKIDFNEYVALNQFTNKMQAAFYQSDRDRSGSLDFQEIFNALVQAGFQLQFPTIQAICSKYDPSRTGRISADSFVQICAQLASIRSIFEWNDQQRSGRVTFSLDQLSHIVIHLFERGQ